MEKIKLCVFDMGGVLVRNFKVKPELDNYFSSMNINLDDYFDCWKSLIDLHGTGLIEEEEFWNRFIEDSGISFPRENESLLGKFFKPTVDNPTFELINKIKDKGIRVVCGTNVLDSHYRIHHELKQYDIFDKVYASHLIHLHKPDAKFFTTICSEENVNPENVFFTDDFEENVDAAKKLGIHAFLYTEAPNLQEQLTTLGVL